MPKYYEISEVAAKRAKDMNSSPACAGGALREQKRAYMRRKRR